MKGDETSKCFQPDFITSTCHLNETYSLQLFTVGMLTVQYLQIIFYLCLWSVIFASYISSQCFTLLV